VFATGGREKDLCVWDLEVGKEVFVARNVKHDKLDMQVPIWITDLAVRSSGCHPRAADVCGVAPLQVPLCGLVFVYFDGGSFWVKRTQALALGLALVLVLVGRLHDTCSPRAQGTVKYACMTPELAHAPSRAKVSLCEAN
jgi:hypothetical protein